MFSQLIKKHARSSAIAALMVVLMLAGGAQAAWAAGGDGVASCGATVFGMERWSPYVAGALIGVLSWLAFLLADSAIGCSGAFVKTAGMVECALTGRKAKEKPYYQLFKPEIGWEWMLVVGIFFGALISALLSGQFQLAWVPALWAGKFGGSVVLRLAAALAGGTFVGFGARWAGGCTSGHGISGTSQLAVSSWVTVAFFFIGGIITAMIIYA